MQMWKRTPLPPHKRENSEKITSPPHAIAIGEKSLQFLFQNKCIDSLWLDTRARGNLNVARKEDKQSGRIIIIIEIN